jgi:hypothetical protein
VLERLGALPMAAVRDRRREELRGMRRVDAPRLDDMATFPAWVALAARHELRVYALAFLAADAIIAQHGLPAVAAYFQRFAGSDDRLGHFHAAFGEELSAFEARVIPVLWSASAPSPARGGGAPN